MKMTCINDKLLISGSAEYWCWQYDLLGCSGASC